MILFQETVASRLEAIEAQVKSLSENLALLASKQSLNPIPTLSTFEGLSSSNSLRWLLNCQALLENDGIEPLRWMVPIISCLKGPAIDWYEELEYRNKGVRLTWDEFSKEFRKRWVTKWSKYQIADFLKGWKWNGDYDLYCKAFERIRANTYREDLPEDDLRTQFIDRLPDHIKKYGDIQRLNLFPIAHPEVWRGDLVTLHKIIDGSGC